LKDNDVDGAITQTIKLMSTKKPKEADITFSLADNAEDKVHFISIPKDTNIAHPYFATDVVKMVQESLELNGDMQIFNMYKFNEFVREKKVKENVSYCYKVMLGRTTRYKYSQQFVEYITYIVSQK